MRPPKLLISLICAVSVFAAVRPAYALTEDVNGSGSVQDDFRGASATGDSINGQVVSASSAGRTRIDATNRSDHMDTRSGDARAKNAGDTAAWTGNAIGGEVVAVVTAAAGSSDIVLANSSLDSDAATGDATVRDFLSPTRAARGRVVLGLDAQAADTASRSRDLLDLQDVIANVTTGDAIVGQVVGVASAGRTRLDATNLSRFDDVLTGDGLARNNGNTLAVTGAGIAGQLIGIVSAAGGAVDSVEANTSTFADILTGDALSENNISTLVGRVDQPETSV
jgi:hypothetical protein